MSNYKFNPLDFGFEPISMFPELSYNYPLDNDGRFIKVSAYSKHGNKYVYWYHSVSLRRFSDDRVLIKSGMHDFRKPNTYEDQNPIGNNTNYSGLISTKEFAITLLKHILGTTKNDSVETYGHHRLISCLGEDMRSESDYY